MPSTPSSEKQDRLRNDHLGISLISKYYGIVFSIIIFVTLYIARGFLLPVFAALLISYTLVPAVRLLCHFHIPRVLAAFVVVAVAFSAAIYSLVALSGPAVAWLEKAPESFDKLSELTEVLKRPVENVNAATEQLNEMTKGDERKRPLVVRLEDSSIGDLILSQTPIVIGAAISTLILLFFLLAFGNVLLKRIVEISPRLSDKKRTVDIARKIESSVSRYLVTVLAINVCLGCCVALSLHLLDFADPIFWGVMATTFNFIPYLGAVAGVCLLTFASMSTSGDLEYALLCPAVYFVLTLIEGNLVTPFILGQSFTVNPIFIILVLLFLGWLWGIPGAIMAVPLLVVLKSAAQEFESTRSIAVLLSK
ncbi:AI-2E family transporter [Pelagicoccus sp. SDUM812002]|uniref:AI-2E family transporter n=1 Tax=Pelagicoccus sp. SDUM812002 TaxID=3041266 RepID=UPI00280EA6CE|nr:AI-2E family transporter [Pelagicoccus sp. SDUM812002]MDQ8187400.1 AI-2E family transporter [Pelagicoccus sp. SDUM812002]